MYIKILLDLLNTEEEKFLSSKQTMRKQRSTNIQ